MIVTVTPNTAVDKVLFVRDFDFGLTIRATRSAWGVGGKGVCASWIMGELGVPCIALGFAAGRAGSRLEEMLHDKGVRTDFVTTAGETRVNVVIVSEKTGTQSTITEQTLCIHPSHVAQLDRKVRDALVDASCLVLGSRLPPDVPQDLYVPWLKLAHERDVPTVLDASGETLRQSIRGRPTVVKPNEDELEQLVGWRPSTWEEVHKAGTQLLHRGVNTVVATRGKHGAMALQTDAAYLLRPIPVPVANVAGAGDAVTAGLAIAASRGASLPEALRLAGAAAAAVCLTDATADCRKDDVERLLDEVRVEEWRRS